MPWALQLRILRNRAKEGEKRFGFVELGFNLVPREPSTLRDQLQPIQGLVGFPQANFDFVFEIRSTSGPVRLSLVCTD
jgi:hypothetical protein